MTHFKNYKPFMAYLTQADIDKLKLYADTNKVPMAQLIREAVAMRMAGENIFAEGYNKGITKAIDVVGDMKMAQLKFPSGTSFAEYVRDELSKHTLRNEEPKEKPNAKSRSLKESV